jgi:ubiquinone/menaquinone biosynthesis C-methylase UbiE
LWRTIDRIALIGTSWKEGETGNLVLHSHGFHDLEDERRKWQNPERILAEIGLKAGFTFIDVGCGDGYFSLPAARIVGEQGRVYAVDISKEAIGRLKNKAKKERLNNLITKVGWAEQTIFCTACADVIFYGIVLHDFDDPEKVLANAGKMAKPNGKLVDLDWKKEPMPIGPPFEIRFDEKRASQLISRAGFRVIEVKQVSPYNYLIVALP